MKSISFVTLLACATLIMSCNSKSFEEILEEDQAEIVEYLTDKGILDEALVTSTGMYYIIKIPGDQDKRPNLNSRVTCNYKGYFTNDEVFDENLNIEFPLGGVIEGWQQGIPFIGEGGTIQLFIPSHLGYGTAGKGDIPGNTVLLFDVDLLNVN